jgi:2'-5' RNA ligase
VTVVRLFLGVELPEGVQRAAAAAADDLRRQVARASRTASIKWVEPANLHVTLWFLGEVHEPRMAALTAALSAPLPRSQFAVGLGEVGAFPPAGSPRVFWIGVRTGREALIAVHGLLKDRLVKLGFEPEQRAYSPHVTLARVKDIRRADLPAVRTILARATAVLDDFTLGSVTLFRSRPSPRGSQYESLLRVPLS